MAATPNLKLETNNSTTDATKKFLSYRMGQNGDISSNMTKIDKWAGDVNTKLTSLENNKPTILVKANWISVGYYEAISSDIVDFKLDMLVTVKLNQDNDGTLTMKINELTVKSFLKYDTTGVLVNLDVGDLRKDREYQFRYDGTSFVWQGGTSADQLNIVGTVGNIVSVADDNTIKDSGVSVGTGALSTTDKTVVGGINELDTRKIDKAQIKNTLTETVEGGVLDATQGKILDDKFSILSTSRGYLRSFKLLNTNMDTVNTNGKYHVSVYDNNTNLPHNTFVGILDVTTNQFGNTAQIAIESYSQNIMYTRVKTASGFTQWKQLATIDTSLNLFNGDITVVKDDVITLKSSILEYNRLVITTGQGGARTWTTTTVYTYNYPNKFVVNDILTIVMPNTNFDIVAVSFKIKSPTELICLDTGIGVRVRNIWGVV